MRKRTAVTIFVAVACVTATGAVAAQPAESGLLWYRSRRVRGRERLGR